MCHACENQFWATGYEPVECPVSLRYEMEARDAEEEIRVSIEIQDALETRGVEFNAMLARKNAGDPFWDEIPF